MLACCPMGRHRVRCRASHVLVLSVEAAGAARVGENEEVLAAARCLPRLTRGLQPLQALLLPDADARGLLAQCMQWVTKHVRAC